MFKKIYIAKIMHIYSDIIYTNVYIFTEFNEKFAQMNIGIFSS